MSKNSLLACLQMNADQVDLELLLDLLGVM